MIEFHGHNGSCCGVKLLHTGSNFISLTNRDLNEIVGLPTRNVSEGAWMFKAQLDPKCVDSLINKLKNYPFSKLVRLRSCYWFTLNSVLPPAPKPSKFLAVFAASFSSLYNVATYHSMRQIQAEGDRASLERDYGYQLRDINGHDNAEVILVDRQHVTMDSCVTSYGYNLVMSTKNPNSSNRINLYLKGDYEMLLDADR
jgi:hypothetical protein